MARLKKAILALVFVGLFLFLAALLLIPFVFIGLSFQDVDDVYRGDAPIAVVRLEGPILNATALSRTVDIISHNPKIRGVLLRIDSPGGGVAASQELYREFLKLAKQKTLYVSMGTVAASGGYYTAVAAKRIYALEGTVTGSMGVIMENVDLTEIAQVLHVKLRTLKSGEMKDAGSMFKEMSPQERDYLQAILSQMHGQFIDAVAAGRGLGREKIVELADGRVFTGQTAKSLGLIDEIGTFYDAMDALKQELGLKGEVEILSADEFGFSRRSVVGNWLQGMIKMVDFSNIPAITPSASRGRVFSY